MPDFSTGNNSKNFELIISNFTSTKNSEINFDSLETNTDLLKKEKEGRKKKEKASKKEEKASNLIKSTKETEIIFLTNNDQEIDEFQIEDFDDSSYHCSFILSMELAELDPSLALAFICVCEEDYEDLVERLNVGSTY